MLQQVFVQNSIKQSTGSKYLEIIYHQYTPYYFLYKIPTFFEIRLHTQKLNDGFVLFFHLFLDWSITHEDFPLPVGPRIAFKPGLIIPLQSQVKVFN